MKTPKLFVFAIIAFISLQTKAQQKLDHAIWDQILLINVSDDGKVDYKGFMRDSAELYKYFNYLSDNPPAENWSKEEKLAYWINAYNAYTIKLIIDNYPLKSIKDIKNPWDRQFFKINGALHSLNELEHKILRKLGEPRIHFAINCASFSCPIVWNRAFTATNVDNALETLTGNFINDPKRNTITEEVVEVSKIFSWFKKDFKVDGEDAKSFINKYAKVKIDKQKKKGYKKYDWSLNE
ncbi:DUF547 domain-containing protein [Aquimarina sp. 433]